MWLGDTVATIASISGNQVREKTEAIDGTPHHKNYKTKVGGAIPAAKKGPWD